MADNAADHPLVISGRLVAVIVAVLQLLCPLGDHAPRPRQHLSDGQLECARAIDSSANAPEQVLTSQAEVASHPFRTRRHGASEGGEYEYQASHRLKHKIGHGLPVSAGRAG